MNALVHAIEVNDRHGAGIFLRRMFGNGDDFVLLRSRTLYEGQNAFGAREEFIGDRFSNLDELRARLSRLAAESSIERILCVPYYPEDFRTAALLKEVTGAPICTYLMDDQNVFSREVGDAGVRRLIDASDLLLGISPQMSLAYEQKYGRRVFWMPPVLPEFGSPSSALLKSKTCALIGNVWSAGRLEELRRVIRESGWTLDWFGRGPEASWLDVSREELAADGIHLMGFLEDSELVTRLAEYPFAIVPSGDAAGSDEMMSFSLLSLPSRVVYLLTQTAIPVLVLGSDASAVGAFVRETGCGEVSEYDPRAFSAAAGRLDSGREKIRVAVGKVAERMVLADAGGWIWKSLDARRPADSRFEDMRSGRLERLPVVVPAERGVSSRGERGWFGRKFGRLEDAAWLRISRKAHLPAIRRRVPLSATGPHTFEVGTYQRALAMALVRSAISGGGRIGLLSGDPEWLRALAADYTVEPVAEPFAGRRFDALLSFDLETPVSRKQLDEMVVAGGLHLHCWTAYQLPGHFRAVPAAMELLDSCDDSFRLMEEMLSDPDFLFMSPKAVEKFWKPADPVAAANAGRPFSLNLCWRS